MKNKQEESNKKVRRILKFDHPPIENYKYGFGKERTLEQYYQFARIDPDARTVSSADEFCNWNEN